MGEIEFHAAPVWLTETYLERILRNYKKDDSLKIIKLKVKPVTGKGENYASVMTRVNVEFVRNNSKDTEQESYIVKTTHEGDAFVANIMNPYEVAQTEMLMYEKVLPKLSELLKEIGDEDKLFADTIHVDYEREAIIFEDLAVLKFVMPDRLAGMDWDLTKLSLKKLAKMHATAAVLNERQPGLLTNFDRGIFNQHTRNFGPFFENMLQEAANFAKDCPELGNYYSDKLSKLKKYVVEYASEVHKPLPHHFNTLTHGDYWVNNVMLRHSTAASNTQDMVIIDFQFCNWTSPAMDLHYFFNTSLINELRFNHEAALLQYYHQILTETLKQLNFGGYIPTLHQFVVQFEEGRFYAITASTSAQPIMINVENTDADFSALMSEDERGHNFRRTAYSNKKIQENLKKAIPLFDRKGLLDIVD